MEPYDDQRPSERVLQQFDLRVHTLRQVLVGDLHPIERRLQLFKHRSRELDMHSSVAADPRESTPPSYSRPEESTADQSRAEDESADDSEDAEPEVPESTEPEDLSQPHIMASMSEAVTMKLGGEMHP